MRILIVLTYFQPHKSGLTVYAVRQARALVDLGHEVTVLTSQYDSNLPVEEWDHDVRIVRLPAAFRISKGVIMPRMPFKAYLLIGEVDVVNLHVPQVDAALLSILAKLRGKPVVLTYHCDLKMPSGLINQAAGWAAHLANRISARIADVIVHNTRDFAEHSPFLNRYLDKLAVIQPPILVVPVTQQDINGFKEKHRIHPEQHVVGMVARLASEKGVEFLVEAMPEILNAVPETKVIFVGEYLNVFGEEGYLQKLMPMIRALGEHWTFMGVVSELEKSVFYRVCDVLVLPSINSTESFGMVQVEAMLSGTPVVATDMPGVRQPVLSSGFGKIVPPKNSAALAEAVVQLLTDHSNFDLDKVSSLREHYSPRSVAQSYVKLFQSLLREDGSKDAG